MSQVPKVSFLRGSTTRKQKKIRFVRLRFEVVEQGFGRPVKNATVQFLKKNGRRGRKARTDSAGKASFSVPTTRYRGYVRARGFATLRFSGDAAKEAERSLFPALRGDVDLNFRVCSNDAKPIPIPGATVTLVRGGKARGKEKTDLDGDARFEKVRVGRYKAKIEAEDYVSKEVNVNAVNPRRKVIRLKDVRRVSVKFMVCRRTGGRFGTPIEGALIEIPKVVKTDEGTKNVLWKKAKTDSKGRATIAGLPHNRQYTVNVAAMDYTSKDVIVDAADEKDRNKIVGLTPEDADIQDDVRDWVKRYEGTRKLADDNWWLEYDQPIDRRATKGPERDAVRARVKHVLDRLLPMGVRRLWDSWKSRFVGTVGSLDLFNAARSMFKNFESSVSTAQVDKFRSLFDLCNQFKTRDKEEVTPKKAFILLKKVLEGEDIEARLEKLENEEVAFQIAEQDYMLMCCLKKWKSVPAELEKAKGSPYKQLKAREKAYKAWKSNNYTRFLDYVRLLEGLYVIGIRSYDIHKGKEVTDAMPNHRLIYKGVLGKFIRENPVRTTLCSTDGEVAFKHEPFNTVIPKLEQLLKKHGRDFDPKEYAKTRGKPNGDLGLWKALGVWGHGRMKHDEFMTSSQVDSYLAPGAHWGNPPPSVMHFGKAVEDACIAAKQAHLRYEDAEDVFAAKMEETMKAAHGGKARINRFRNNKTLASQRQRRVFTKGMGPYNWFSTRVNKSNAFLGCVFAVEHTFVDALREIADGKGVKGQWDRMGGDTAEAPTHAVVDDAPAEGS